MWCTRRLVRQNLDVGGSLGAGWVSDAGTGVLNDLITKYYKAISKNDEMLIMINCNSFARL